MLKWFVSGILSGLTPYTKQLFVQFKTITTEHLININKYCIVNGLDRSSKYVFMPCVETVAATTSFHQLLLKIISFNILVYCCHPYCFISSGCL